MKLTNKELRLIQGGAWSAAYLNAILRGVNTILEIGRNIGSFIRRLGNNNICPIP